MDKYILLSVDLEEFDIPEEYGQKVSDTDKIAVSAEGLAKILVILEKLDISATFFSTVYFAEKRPDLVKQITGRHELASHGVSHAGFRRNDLFESRIFLEQQTGKKISGFRHPRFQNVNHRDVLDAGYEYSSSENPIWLPGRYMNFFNPRLPYFTEGLCNLPVSASPVIRFPFFWLSFKNSPSWLFDMMSYWTLNADGYLNIFFHPWEFADISAWDLPGYIKNPCGADMIKKAEKCLGKLKRRGRFITCAEFVQVKQKGRIK